MTSYRDAIRKRLAEAPPIKGGMRPSCNLEPNRRELLGQLAQANSDCKILLRELEKAEAALEFARDCVDSSQSVGIEATDEALASLRATLDEEEE